MELILASASPRRKELLARLGFPFTIQISHVEERSEGPWMMLALENACVKAEEVAARYPDSVVIGADTVIEFDNRILGKPHDLPEAERMLTAFSGKTHAVTTGCAVICRSRNLRVRFAETAQVTFRRLLPETVRRYLSLVSVLDKAGAYAIQEHGELIIERCVGDPDTVVGLPVTRLGETLKLFSGLEFSGKNAEMR